MKRMSKRLGLAVLTFLFIGLPALVSAAGPVTVDSINSAIEESGAKWTAGETSVSQLPEDARRALLGLKKRDLENYLPGSIKVTGKMAVFSTTLDWRDKDSCDWTTPIRNQDACGSCWAFGSMAVVESMTEIESGDCFLNPDGSEQFMVSCSAGSCDGWYMDTTADFLKNTGATDEPCFPYVAQDRPCDERCPDWESRIQKISDWGWVGGTWELATVDEIKEELQYGPLFGSMMIYEDFYYYTEGIYEHVWGEESGGHAITIVGWDDANHCWICKNSWGTGWGEGGWFRIKMGVNEVGIEQETIWFDIEAQVSCEEDDSGALDIAGKAGAPGFTVSIPVRIQSAPNMVESLGFEVVFPDSILAFTGFTRGPLVENFDFFDCTIPAGEYDIVRCGGFEAGPDTIPLGASGDVVHLDFDVVDCESGVSYPLDLQELKDDIADWSASFGCFQCGCDCDINGDGEITPQDALCAFQTYLGVCPTDCGPCEDICCDVTLDDDCTPQDALEIFRDYLGIYPNACSPEPGPECTPPPYNPEKWNDGGSIQHSNNCYNYANDEITMTFAQPGRWCGDMYSSLTCEEVYPAAACDGLVSSDAMSPCPDNMHKVYLVVWPGHDYHWYRQDIPDGMWSHKPGGTAVRDWDESGQPISDPETADTGWYTTHCGYMCACGDNATIR